MENTYYISLIYKYLRRNGTLLEKKLFLYSILKVEINVLNRDI
jgi:hypothetical protein